MKSFFKFIGVIVKNIMDDHVPAYAAEVSFFMVVSALPLLVMMIPLIRYVIPISEETLVNMVIMLLPNSAEMQDLVRGLMSDIYLSSAGTLAFISIAAVLWAASKGIYALQVGLNTVAGTVETRNYAVRRLGAIGYTIMFVLILIFTIAMLMFGDKFRLLIEYVFPLLAHFMSFIKMFQTLLSITILLFFFVLVYTIFPNRKIAFWRTLPGAIFSTICWTGFTAIYSLYVRNIAGFSYLYGSMTALILMMLWIYICMFIALIGAELNKMVGWALDKRKEKKRTLPPEEIAAVPGIMSTIFEDMTSQLPEDFDNE